ncbi:MAG: OadG-related small transporter subunit [Planctomycetota bacterium]|nr:OadG-related small transporter subunit [Planctomycetota bacterium]
MVDLKFGLVLAGVGAGATFLVLFIISLLCTLLKRIFPYEEEKKC